MKKFLEVVSVTSILIGLASGCLFVGSQIPRAENWFGVIALVSWMILAVAGASEWVYNKGARDEYNRTKRLDDIGGHDE